MKANTNLKSSVATLVNPHPVLAGKVRTLMSSCGKPGCKCMKKNNPEKHSYNQLSYTHEKKTKTMYVKKSNIEVIKKMTDNYKDLRQATLNLGHEAAVLIKAHGVEEAESIITDTFDQVRQKVMNIKPESVNLRKIRASRKNWKNKAMARQAVLGKNRVQIRDIKKSRKSWKLKAINTQKQIKTVQKELKDANKKISRLEKKLDSKKNFTEQGR